MKKKTRALAVLSAGIVGAGAILLGACNKGPEVPPGFTGTAISFYATYVNQYSSAAYTELVETYNETQGVEDNVYVEMTPNAGSVGNLKSILTGVSSRYDVVMVQDDQFKGLAMEEGRTGGGVFVNLEDLLTEDAKEELDWDQIPESLLNIWRFNTEKESADSAIGAKYLAGQGADLLAMPFNSSVHMLFYNTKIFSDMGINIVSVAEEDCGTGEYAKLMPHGYAEYAASYGAPFEGAKLSENELGESVYKVFNNRVPLSWEELRCLARAYQTHNNGGYGFMSEWWFSIGWSVGGDCIGWNEERKAYDFTIGDKNANFLALNDITVNGTQYEKGEVLDYEDMKYLHANDSVYQQLSEDLYELPSMYDAFLEFNRLGIPEGKVAATDAGPNNDQTVEGYGVAKPTTQNRTTEFTAGESPMLIETSQDVNLFNGTAVAGNFDVAPCPQYREFEGTTTRTVNGEEYLTLIDGTNYTGERKTVTNSDGEEVLCQGEAITSIDDSNALAIPMNIDDEAKAAAFKFICWAAGPEGQTILAKGNTCVPNQTNIAMSEEFNDSADRKIDNTWAIGFAMQDCYVGDWSYFNVNTWITGWSGPLNSSVREGNMTLTQFLADYSESATSAISTMQIRIKGK